MTLFGQLFFRSLVRQADDERDSGLHRQAATTYARALRLRPRHAGLLVQHGHMLKEIGQLDAAEAEYRKALHLRPDDADLHLQLGHLQKRAGKFDAAYRCYRRALQLAPGWSVPASETAFLQQSGVRDPDVELSDLFEFVWNSDKQDAGSIARGWTCADRAGLAPSLAPRPLKHELHRQRRGLEIRQLGRDEMGPWGKRRTLRGIEAIRGFIVCDTAATEVQIIINGLPMHRQDVRGPFPVDRQDEGVFGKYVFNIWLDFSIFSHGLHRLEVRVVGEAGEMESAHEDVVIASAVLESAYPHSDGLIAPCRDDPRPLEEQVRMRPNQVHQARREIFPKGVRNILVARTDQLGDMVASIPAMRRLRQLLPDAHIVGLLTAANADFARTLDVFDEVITVDFPDDPIERRRLMPLEEQEVLRRRLATYAFDVAIDLAQADVSRDLLLLAGAKFTYGTGGGDWPWLSADFSFHSHDRWTGHDMTPHSAKVLGLIETFGALLKTSAPVIRRSDLTRERLVKYGITPADRFAVLHTGARIGFSHWPHYHHIAERLIRETDLKVVMITDDAVHAQKLPLFVATHDRFVHLCGKLPFDDFDALLSYATVMLGNDSGPKHLASLRGTKVVTIFSARINWAEWGQENIGVVISRKVPCAGCALLHDADECGKEFACVNDIEPNGVFDEMLKQIGDAHG